jgi:hypothetical protein
MEYDGEGRGFAAEQVFRGESEVSLDNALRAAVRSMPSDTPEGTRVVVLSIEVTTKGDPNIGSYSVLLGAG